MSPTISRNAPNGAGPDQLKWWETTSGINIVSAVLPTGHGAGRTVVLVAVVQLATSPITCGEQAEVYKIF